MLQNSALHSSSASSSASYFFNFVENLHKRAAAEALVFTLFGRLYGSVSDLRSQR